jgi:magnesium-transporting ATPase (P-type)
VKQLKDASGCDKFGITMDLNFRLKVQHPNSSLYNFQGYLEFVEEGKSNSQEIKSRGEDQNPVDNVGSTPKPSKFTQSVENKNFIFKGSKIRNTSWVLGMVLYTGKDTKILQNGLRVRNKVSHLE